MNNGGCGANAQCSHDATTFACKCGCLTGFVNTGSSGSVVCSLASGNVIGYVKSAHINATNPGFSTGACPASPDNYPYGWHFVITDTSSSFLAVNCTFKNAGVVTKMVQSPTTKHAYVFTPTADTLLGAWAVVNGPLTVFPLSHVCTPTA